MEQLQLLINELYPSATLEDSSFQDFKFIVHDKKKILLFIKKITGEVAFYNLSISRLTFGPELIHEEDYKKVQLQMKDSKVEHCVYVIHSTDKQTFDHQYTFPLDIHYINWITDV